MSSRVPTSVGFSWARLAARGGGAGPHRDGWGVAFFDGADAVVLREPAAASDSELARYIERHPPPSGLVISHIRLATHGECSLRNTQPFTRELGGRKHVFAHNGELAGIEQQSNFQPKRFKPVGVTDSELVFCELMDRLGPLWDRIGDRVPSLVKRMNLIVELAAELRPFGPANFLYTDSDVLFVHAHRRTQVDGAIAPPGLHVLHRTCEECLPDMAGSGVTLTTVQQTLTLAASVPLTDEPWRPLAEGEVLAIRGGEILVNRLP